MLDSWMRAHQGINMSFQESSDASLNWLCPEEETDGVLAAERISRILKASHVLIWVCLLLGDPRKLCLFILVPFKTDQKRVPSKILFDLLLFACLGTVWNRAVSGSLPERERLHGKISIFGYRTTPAAVLRKASVTLREMQESTA